MEGHCRISVNYKSVCGVGGQGLSLSLGTSCSKDPPHTLSQSRVQELVLVGEMGVCVRREDDRHNLAMVTS